MTEPTPDDVIETYPAIGRALSELYGCAISEDAAFRLSVRKDDPLPVKGYSGRSFIRRSVLVAWFERNEYKSDTAKESAQMPLFGEREPR